jgi:hypothetical protein
MTFRFWPLQAREPSTEYMIRYLLGELPESSTNKFEERLLGDVAAFESLSAVEAELIDAYVHGRLSEGRRSRFEQRFFASPMQREKIANAMMLANHANGVPMATSFTVRGRWIVMAAALLLVVSASLLLFRQPRQQRRPVPQSGQPLGTAPPHTRTADPIVTTFVLSEGQQRGTGRPATLSISHETQIVRFQVQLGARRYQRYRATVETPDGVRLWSKSNLKGPNLQDRGMMSIDVPAVLLRGGAYIVTLAGEAGETEELVGEYSVEVSR